MCGEYREIAMTAQDYAAARHRLGINKVAFARAIGIAPNTATAYEAGRNPIPRYIALAIAAVLYGLPPA